MRCFGLLTAYNGKHQRCSIPKHLRNRGGLEIREVLLTPMVRDGFEIREVL